MIITWTTRVDLSRHIDFRLGNVLRINGQDYCVLTSDDLEVTAWPANSITFDPIPYSSLVKLRWTAIQHLHIY